MDCFRNQRRIKEQNGSKIPELKTQMPLHKIAVIGGDRIGPEVTHEACIILSALQDSLHKLKLEFTEFDWGSEYFLKTGRMMLEDELEQLKSFEAILFGSAGSL